jgi:hypothetical protein
MMRRYRFELKGTAGHGEDWAAHGTITCEFADALHAALRQAFEQLAEQRRAGRCFGPYEVKSARFERSYA